MSNAPRRAYGELEAQVLQVLWSAETPLTAKQIQRAMPGDAPAHTTILTALTRLSTKGDVERVGHAARGIRFAATRTEAEHAGLGMLRTLNDTSDRQAALMRFMGDLDDTDLEFLQRELLREPKGERS